MSVELDMRWFAATTLPRQEMAMAAENLRAQEFEVPAAVTGCG